MFGIYIVVFIAFCAIIANARNIFLSVKGAADEKKLNKKWEDFKKEHENYDGDDHVSRSCKDFDTYLRYFHDTSYREVRYPNRESVDSGILFAHNVAFIVILAVTLVVTIPAVLVSRHTNDIDYEAYESAYEYYQGLADRSYDKDVDLFSSNAYERIMDYNDHIVQTRTKQNNPYYDVYFTDKHDWDDLKLVEF